MKTSESQVAKESDLHVAHLTDMQKHFVENSLKVSGFLLLALGWYATSNDAREFLVSTPSVTVLASIAVLTAYCLTVLASWVVYQSSKKVADHLKELAYLPRSAYEGRILHWKTGALCIVGNGVLAGFLIVALLSTPK